MRLGLALGVSAASGFIALSYEILWYRVVSFTSSGLAAAFGLLLAAYLAGIAIGARIAGAFCKEGEEPSARHLRIVAGFAFVANVAAWLVVPAFAWSATHTDWPPALAAVAIASALLGAILPLVSHFGIRPDDRAGTNLSYVYLANILGSALGSIVTGFVLLDRFTLERASTIVGALGMGLSVLLVSASGGRRGARAIAVLVTLGASVALLRTTPALFDRIWERLLYRTNFRSADHRFAEVIENKSGVITVTKDGIVYGGGVYDGKINTSLVYDVNGIQRAYGIAAMHPAPRSILMVGLASGSWAKVVSEMPGLERLTVVEINPGYLELVGSHPEVRSLLSDPKVEIVIDDGRRWLLRSPRRFDVIVMNTTFHWRAHATSLLSLDFMEIVREHLAPGGFLFFNATYSVDVQRTGFTAFAHGLRVFNCIAVGDSPVVFDGERFRRALARWRLDGQPVLDLGLSRDRDVMERMMAYADTLSRPPEDEGLESRESVLRRTEGAVVITDDNMLPEWKTFFRPAED